MKQNNIKVAVTGGIASGKTTVCNYIKEQGFALFSCDEIYAELLTRGAFTEKLTSEFGNDILAVDGGIDRHMLANAVFSDSNKLKKLNEITHPLIFSEMFRRAENCKGLVFFEVPVLFECGYEKLFNEVVVVQRDINERILSLANRNKLSLKEAQIRIESQMNYDNCKFEEYYVIHNQGNIDNLREVIRLILAKMARKYGL